MPLKGVGRGTRSAAQISSGFPNLIIHSPLYYTGIGGSGQDLRCKTRTLTKVTSNPDDL